MSIYPQNNTYNGYPGWVREDCYNCTTGIVCSYSGQEGDFVIDDCSACGGYGDIARHLKSGALKAGWPGGPFVGRTDKQLTFVERWVEKRKANESV